MHMKLFILTISIALFVQLTQQYAIQTSDELDEENLIYNTPRTVIRSHGLRYRRESAPLIDNTTTLVVFSVINHVEQNITYPSTTTSAEFLAVEGSGQELPLNNQVDLAKEQIKRQSAEEVNGSGQDLPHDASGEELQKNVVEEI